MYDSHSPPPPYPYSPNDPMSAPLYNGGIPGDTSDPNGAYPHNVAGGEPMPNAEAARPVAASEKKKKVEFSDPLEEDGYHTKAALKEARRSAEACNIPEEKKAEAPTKPAKVEEQKSSFFPRIPSAGSQVEDMDPSK